MQSETLALRIVMAPVAPPSSTAATSMPMLKVQFNGSEILPELPAAVAELSQTAAGSFATPWMIIPSTVIEMDRFSGGLSAYSSSCRPASLFHRDEAFAKVMLTSSRPRLVGSRLAQWPACGAVLQNSSCPLSVTEMAMKMGGKEAVKKANVAHPDGGTGCRPPATTESPPATFRPHRHSPFM